MLYFELHALRGPRSQHCSACEQAISNIAGVLKPGVGQVLVRDYAFGDLAQVISYSACAAIACAQGLSPAMPCP